MARKFAAALIYSSTLTSCFPRDKYDFIVILIKTQIIVVGDVQNMYVHYGII